MKVLVLKILELEGMRSYINRKRRYWKKINGSDYEPTDETIINWIRFKLMKDITHYSHKLSLQELLDIHQDLEGRPRSH